MTPNQRAWLHALINDVADNVTVDGKLKPREAWKEFFKKQLHVKSVADLSDADAWLFIEHLESFCLAQGVPIVRHIRRKGRYENKAYRECARLSPRCFYCDKPNEGDVVMAHANAGEFGKGLGIKASDASCAPLCYTCHTKLDQSKLSEEERNQLHLTAFRRWIVYAIEHGILALSPNVDMIGPAG